MKRLCYTGWAYIQRKPNKKPMPGSGGMPWSTEIVFMHKDTLKPLFHNADAACNQGLGYYKPLHSVHSVERAMSSIIPSEPDGAINGSN